MLKTIMETEQASRPDEENPEWSREQIRNARPALEVFAEVFGPAAAEMLRRGRGRPAKADTKINQTLRLDADVLDAYRRSGPGWQVRMNQVLREHMPASGR
ncbi:BrnA antitoxin family protein [Rhodopila sp.]|uniref:BrnA antitoxin family protein n=1 Tax=Rhodopila sp. TaxID=2480087 RepID=UPI003D1039D5